MQLVGGAGHVARLDDLQEIAKLPQIDDVSPPSRPPVILVASSFDKLKDEALPY
jgi:hypothetical protein